MWSNARRMANTPCFLIKRAFASTDYASSPLLKVDVHKSPSEQPFPLHNRWHPDIPSVASVTPDQVFRVECVDWTGGQIKNNDDADDVRDVDLTQVHYMTGPIHVDGAKPGDVLVVDILDLGPLPSHMWGFTGIFEYHNGGGFLDKHFPRAHKAIWEFEGIYARSRHIQGVKFAGLMHPGVMGCAPSQDLLETWNSREGKLALTHPRCCPPIACLPNSSGALLGGIERGRMWDKIASQAARTVPPRENGSNLDIKNLSRGSRAYFPVYVDGAKLSLGDIHFSQGDGEITFCGAIETAGWLDLKLSIIPGGVKKLAMDSPIFTPGPMEPHYADYLTFQGISVDEKGAQHFLDATVAYRKACLNAINYLKRFGYTGEQAYVILGSAPVKGQISGIVDVPNACCSLAIPKAIFDFDISPEAPSVTTQRGILPTASSRTVLQALKNLIS